MATTYTIKIGHAASSEHKSITGTAGDQTGEEVFIVNSYDVNKRLAPSVLLRPKSKALAEKSAKACEDGCANNKIGYSQWARETLYNEAEKVNFDLSKITTPCNCDCSSFMTLCAIAGGAKIKYEDKSPVCRGMESVFVASGDYTAIKTNDHLKQTNYLKRGDILVKAGRHTVMVLEDGEDHEASGYEQMETDSETSVTLPTNENISEKVYYINIKVDQDNVGFDRLDSASCKVIIKKSKTNKAVKKAETKEFINKYNWYYKLTPITGNSKKAITELISMSSGGTIFSIKNLVPNTVYSLKILAKTKTKKKVKLCSPTVFFTTKKPNPSTISDIKLRIDSNLVNFLNPKCSISFNAPKSWNNNGTSASGYRISLIVNNTIKAYSDNLIEYKNNNEISKTIYIRDITTKKLFDATDTIQIGIQAWNRDINDNYFFDNDLPICSQTFYVMPPGWVSISHIYLKIKDTFNHVIIDHIKGA